MPEFLKNGKEIIPTLGGIKFTNNNLQEAAECLTVDRDVLTVFLGNEQVCTFLFFKNQCIYF